MQIARQLVRNSSRGKLYIRTMSEAISHNEVKEGKAAVFVPKKVFYNPIQEFNRDVSVAVISQYAKEILQNRGVEVSNIEPGKRETEGLKIFEGLSASGLRSCRYAKEIGGLNKIVVNDYDRSAVEMINKNIEHSGIQDLAEASFGDASFQLHMRREEEFDVIDIDPFGTPTRFLDAAVQTVSDGGLLCVTCTDVAVLCGNAAESCWSKYGSMSFRSKFCHEMALRIVLHCLEKDANRYGRYIEPVLSISVDYYVRLFVKVHTGVGKVKQSASKTSMVYHCVGCGDFHLQPICTIQTTAKGGKKYTAARGPPCADTCQHCDSKFQIGGPIWSEPIHDVKFVERVIERTRTDLTYLGTQARVIGMLSLISEELVDRPLFFVTDQLCNILHCTSPSMLKIRSAILHAGYRVSMSHAAKSSIKTDAPTQLIWDIFREFVKENPVSKKRMKEGTLAHAILSKEQKCEINFKPHANAEPRSKQEGLLRYQLNPEPNWGPGRYPSRKEDEESESQKSEENNKKVDQETKKSEGSGIPETKKFKAEGDD